MHSFAPYIDLLTEHPPISTPIKRYVLQLGSQLTGRFKLASFSQNISLPLFASNVLARVKKPDLENCGDKGEYIFLWNLKSVFFQISWRLVLLFARSMGYRLHIKRKLVSLRGKLLGKTDYRMEICGYVLQKDAKNKLTEGIRRWKARVSQIRPPYLSGLESL